MQLYNCKCLYYINNSCYFNYQQKRYFMHKFPVRFRESSSNSAEIFFRFLKKKKKNATKILVIKGDNSSHASKSDLLKCANLVIFFRILIYFPFLIQ